MYFSLKFHLRVSQNASFVAYRIVNGYVEAHGEDTIASLA